MGVSHMNWRKWLKARLSSKERVTKLFDDEQGNRLWDDRWGYWITPLDKSSATETPPLRLVLQSRRSAGPEWGELWVDRREEEGELFLQVSLLYTDVTNVLGYRREWVGCRGITHEQIQRQEPTSNHAEGWWTFGPAQINKPYEGLYELGEVTPWGYHGLMMGWPNNEDNAKILRVLKGHDQLEINISAWGRPPRYDEEPATKGYFIFDIRRYTEAVQLIR